MRCAEVQQIGESQRGLRNSALSYYNMEPQKCHLDKE